MAATATRSRAATLMRAKPLVVDLGEVTSRYVMSDHAIERANERGVGVFEVYSAIADPDHVQPGQDGADSASYTRGDIRVAVTPNRFGDGHTIKTVIDRYEDERQTPRVPLDPMKAGAMSARKQSNPQVLDEAWCLVPHPEEDYRKITITPVLAEKLLGLNTANRPIRPRHVAEWKRKMASGEYKATHQGIAIDTTGALQDGQHRLAAIVELGEPREAWVLVGAPPEHFVITDVGLNRNYSDVLALKGETDTNVLGSTVRMAWLYLHHDGTWAGIKVSNVQVAEMFDKDPARFRDAVRIGRQVSGAAYGLTRTAAAAGWYLIRRINTAAKTEEFFEGIISGADMRPGDPRLVLGRKLRNDDHRAWGAEHLALLIKCWNLWATGAENVRLIAWRKGEAMPQVTRAS